METFTMKIYDSTARFDKLRIEASSIIIIASGTLERDTTVDSCCQSYLKRNRLENKHRIFTVIQYPGTYTMHGRNPILRLQPRDPCPLRYMKTVESPPCWKNLQLQMRGMPLINKGGNLISN